MKMSNIEYGVFLDTIKELRLLQLQEVGIYRFFLASRKGKIRFFEKRVMSIEEFCNE